METSARIERGLEIPSIDVILPSFNKLSMTQECLQSLRANAGLDNYRIIFVDNGSTDGTQEWIKREGMQGDDSFFGFAENTMITGAWNQGLKMTSAPLVAIFNNDLLFSPGFLQRLAEPLVEYPDLVSVSVPVCFDSTEGFAAHATRLAEVEHYNLLFGFRFFGAAFMMTRQVIDEVGEFDPEMRMIYQDNDYYERLLRWRKHPIALALNAAVYHYGSVTQLGVTNRQPVLEADQLAFQMKWIGDLTH